MDWIGIVFFVLVMVIKALGESEKQKKARQARQGRPRPGAPPAAEEPRPSREAMPPVAKPDFELPPIFSFPFEEVDEDEDPIIFEEPAPPSQPELVPEQPVYREQAGLPRSPADTAGRELVPRPVLKLDQAMAGIVWSEILQPPRALRPPGSPWARGRGWR